MKESKTKLRDWVRAARLSGFAVAAVFVALAPGISYAANTACTNATAFTQPPPIGLTTTAGSINDPNGGFTAGCTTVDTLFNNFSSNAAVSYSTGTTTPTDFGYSASGTTGADPTLAGIFVTAQTAATGGGLEFTAPCTGGGCHDSTDWYASAGGTQDTVFYYTGDSNNSVTGLTTVSVTQAELSITVAEPAGAGGGKVEVIENICLGVSVWSSSCSSPDQIVLNENNIGTSLKTYTGSVTFAAATEFATQTEILLTTGPLDTVYLSNFTEDFGTVAPEPSSLLLIGSVLACLFFVGIRRRRSSSI